jgi:PAS domain S-box-containing protein
MAMATLLLCAGYYASGVIAIALRFEPGGIAGVWLPHAILVAALLLSPARSWWLYLAALFPTHLHLVRTFQGPVPLTVMLIQFGGNMAQGALSAAVLLRILGHPPRLGSLSRMGAFIVVAAMLAPVLVSGVVARLFLAVGWVEDFWIAWQRRSLSLMCAAVIVGAPIIHLATGGLAEIRRAPRRLFAEFVALTAGLIAVLLASFAWEAPRAHHSWLLFGPLLLLLWSAVRFGPGVLGFHLVAIMFVDLLSTKAGRGPFAAGTAPQMLLALQGYFLATSIPLMLLAALVQEHAHAAASLQQSEARYRSVVEDQTELICRFLHDGTYTFVNGAYCRYFQRSPRELIGQRFWQFLPPEQHAASRAFLDSITPEHPVATIEHPVTGPGGEVRWQQWIDRGFFDDAGRIVEYQAVGHDVTERKRAEEEHRQLLAQTRVAETLREVDRRKDEFLAMLAHELRNPLAPISTAVEILRLPDPDDDSILWAREVIARQTAQLTRLVDDLLDVSRITLGKIKLSSTTLDLSSVVSQAVEISRPLLASRNHELSIHVPNAPLPVRGDVVRLTQVFSNLLNNAAKYTGDGGHIALSVERTPTQIIVKVADNGIGIPAQMRERVFDMFTQLDGPADSPREGLGIGLALVKQLVEMHDGTVEARSEGPGRGSELVVRLPVAIVPAVAGLPPEGLSN